jgi:hypothetical protein
VGSHTNCEGRWALAYWTTEPATDAAEILARGRVVVADLVTTDA